MRLRCKSRQERVPQGWVRVLYYVCSLNTLFLDLTSEQLSELEAQRIQLTSASQLPDDDDDDDPSSWQDISDAARLDGILWGNEVIEISHEGGEFELARELRERLSIKWRKQRMYA